MKRRNKTRAIKERLNMVSKSKYNAKNYLKQFNSLKPPIKCEVLNKFRIYKI